MQDCAGILAQITKYANALEISDIDILQPGV